MLFPSWIFHSPLSLQSLAFGAVLMLATWHGSYVYPSLLDCARALSFSHLGAPGPSPQLATQQIASSTTGHPSPRPEVERGEQKLCWPPLPGPTRAYWVPGT